MIFTLFIFFSLHANAKDTPRSNSGIKCMQKMIETTPKNFRDKNLSYQFIESTDGQDGVPTIIRHDMTAKEIEIIRPDIIVKIDQKSTSTDLNCSADPKGGEARAEEIAKIFLATHFHENPSWDKNDEIKNVWKDKVCKDVFPQQPILTTKTAASPTSMKLSNKENENTSWSGSIKCMQKVIEVTLKKVPRENVSFQFLDSIGDEHGGVPTIIRHDIKAKKIEIIRPNSIVKINEPKTVKTNQASPRGYCSAYKDDSGGGIHEGEKIAKKFLATHFDKKPDWVTNDETKKAWNEAVSYCKNVFPEHPAFKTEAVPSHSRVLPAQ